MEVKKTILAPCEMLAATGDCVFLPEDVAKTVNNYCAEEIGSRKVLDTEYIVKQLSKIDSAVLSLVCAAYYDQGLYTEW